MLNKIQLGHLGVMMIEKRSDHGQHFVLILGFGGCKGGFSNISRVGIRFILEAPDVSPKCHSHVMKCICTNQTSVIRSIGSFSREINLIVFKDFAQKYSVGQGVVR